MIVNYSVFFRRDQDITINLNNISLSLSLSLSLFLSLREHNAPVVPVGVINVFVAN